MKTIVNKMKKKFLEFEFGGANLPPQFVSMCAIIWALVCEWDIMKMQLCRFLRDLV